MSEMGGRGWVRRKVEDGGDRWDERYEMDGMGWAGREVWDG